MEWPLRVLHGGSQELSGPLRKSDIHCSPTAAQGRVRYSSKCAVLWLRGITVILAHLLVLSFSKLDLKVIKMFIERAAFTSVLLLIRVPSGLLSR